MKNETNLFKRIRNIIVGNTLPKNEDLWIDTTNGEKNAVLKYKGNPLGGGGSGSGSGCDCGGFKYNELPEPAQFRDPTQDDIAKFTLSRETLLAVLDLKDTIVPNQIILEESDPILNFKDSLIFYIAGFNNTGGVGYTGISNTTVVSITGYLSNLLDTEVTYLKLSQDGTMIGAIQVIYS